MGDEFVALKELKHPRSRLRCISKEETHRSMIGELKKKGKTDLICPSPTLKAKVGQHSVYSVLGQKGIGRLNNWLVFWIY
jgi:hypothetical protein